MAMDNQGSRRLLYEYKIMVRLARKRGKHGCKAYAGVILGDHCCAAQTRRVGRAYGILFFSCCKRENNIVDYG